MKRLFCVLSAVVLSVFVVSCGEDSESGPGGGHDYDIHAQIEGGEVAGSVNGQSEQSVPSFFSGSLAAGELVVYLSTNDASVVFFTVDVASTEVPGTVSVTRALDQDAYLTYTSGTTAMIYEGSSGSITVGACPNMMGAIVTGTFNDVGLVNVATESSGGTLSGNWQVAITTTDGSANCSGGGGGGGDDPGPSPGTSCQNDACDGPCCPYLPALQSCNLACAGSNDCTDPIGGNPMNCLTCFAGCPDESGMTGDAACMSAANALDSCGTTHSCDMVDMTAENTCIADNCCSEYQAVF